MVLLNKTKMRGFFPHHKSDMTLTGKPIPFIEKIALWILTNKKGFFPWVSQEILEHHWPLGSVHAERPAVQESSKPWLFPAKAPAISVSLLPWGSFLWQRERRTSTEKLLGTYVCMFVYWHLRKIAQELLGHIAHILATLQLLFFLLEYISNHLKGQHGCSSWKEIHPLTMSLYSF